MPITPETGEYVVLYSRRKKLEKENKKVGEFFVKFGLPPNQWTSLSIIFALITSYAIIGQDFILAGLLFALTAIMDIADGSVARARNVASNRGAYLDTVADRYAEFIVIAGLLFAGMPGFIFPFSLWLFIYLFGSMMTTYVKAAAKEKNVVGEETKGGGALERSERMIVLFLGLLLAAYSKTYFTYVIIILAVLSNVTALQRFNMAMKNVQTGNPRKNRP